MVVADALDAESPTELLGPARIAVDEPDRREAEPAESGQMRRMFGTVDLSALVRELAESYAPAIADGGRRFHATIERNLTVPGDRELLAQAIINLLENAQSHTEPGTRITLSAAAAAGVAVVEVADNGPGVAEDDRERIVRRFIRLEASRSTPGHGLGLNLVSAIARLHGGALRFADNHPGLKAILELPDGRGPPYPAAAGEPERDIYGHE